MIYVVDTHALVWHLEANPSLSAAAVAALGDNDSQFVIPTIVIVEMWYLYQRKRIRTSIESLRGQIISARNCSVYPLDDAVVQLLPQGLDIHDAIIVATARVYRDVLKLPTRLITCDQKIVQSGSIEVLW